MVLTKIGLTRRTGIVALLICAVWPVGGQSEAAPCGDGGNGVIALATVGVRSEIGDRVFVLPDHSPDSTIEDVTKLGSTGRFQRSCEARIAPPGFGRVLWIRMTVDVPGNSDAERVLVFDDTYIDRVDFYRPADDGTWVRESNGRTAPFGERRLKSRTPVFRLALKAGETRDFYFRIDASAASAIFPVLMMRAAYEGEEFKRIVVLGVIFGFMGAVVLFIAYLFIVFRLPELAFFGGYAFCLLWVNLGYEGYLTRFVPFALPGDLMNFIVEGLSVVATLCFLQTARLLLRLKLRMPRADRAVVVVMALYATFVVWSTFFTALSTWFSHAIIVGSSLYIIAIGMMLGAEGDRSAKYFALARLCHMFGLVPDLWFHYSPVLQHATPSAWEQGLAFLEAWVYFLGLAAQIALMTVSMSIVIANSRARRVSNEWRESPDTESTALNASGHRLLDSARLYIRENVADEGLNVAHLAKALATSESSLRRRLQDIGGITPADLIRDERLKYANILLTTGSVSTVSEAAGKVGFRTPSHFARLYQKTYDASPKEHLRMGRDHARLTASGTE